MCDGQNSSRAGEKNNNGRTAAAERGTTLGYFQLARGLGMLFIIAGHSITPFFDKDAAYAAGQRFAGAGSVFGGGVIAMFFMISGFGLFFRMEDGQTGGKKGNRKKRTGFFAMQLHEFWIPYVLTAAAVLLGKGLIAVWRNRSFLLHGGELVLTFLLGLNAEGGGTFFGFPVDSVSVLWFLLALSGGSVLWYLLYGISTQKRIPRGLYYGNAALLAAVGVLLCRMHPVLPFCFAQMLLACGYIAAGDAIAAYRLLDRRLPWFCHAGMLLLILFSFAFGGVNIVAGFFLCGFLDFAATVCIGFYLLRLYACLFQHLPEKDVAVLSFAETVGRYSLQILCIHAAEKMLFPWYRLRFYFPTHPVWCAVLCFLLRIVLIFACLSLMEWVRRRGRKRTRRTRRMR